MRRLPLVLPALALLLLLGGASWQPVDAPLRPFSVKDLEGRVLRSEDLRGKVVVIDFWASWCGPCLRELPELLAYHERLAGRSDVALLSFNVTEQAKTVRAFAKKNKIPYPVYLADDLIGPYGLNEFPTKLVIDLRGPGVVRYRRAGFTPVSEIEAKLSEVLQQPGRAQ